MYSKTRFVGSSLSLSLSDFMMIQFHNHVISRPAIATSCIMISEWDIILQSFPLHSYPRPEVSIDPSYLVRY